MFKIYRTAFQFTASNPKIFITLAIFIFAVRVFIQLTGANVSSSVIAWVVISYILHRSLMFDETNLMSKPQHPKRPQWMGRYIAVASGFPFVCFILAASIGLYLIPASEPRALIALIIIVMILSLIILLSIFGTMLPAIAAADRFGFGVTLKRAKSTWYKILGGLLIGPVLFSALYYAGIFWLVTNVVPIEPYYTKATGVQLEQVLIGMITTCFQLFNFILSIVVLTLAYRDVAPESVKAEMEESLLQQ